jgi:hypothetical protein
MIPSQTVTFQIGDAHGGKETGYGTLKKGVVKE